jgi:VWFA-related protein
MHSLRRGFVPLFGLLAGLAAASSLYAQTREQPKAPVLPSVTTEVVRLDVTVSERGRPKAGLTREDFAIFEDGKPQAIIHFEAVAGPAEAGAPAGVAQERTHALAPRRYVVLAIDDLHMEIDGVSRMRKSLARFVQEDLGPADQVAIMTTTGAGNAPRFTADRETLLRSISRLSLQNRRSEWGSVPFISEYQAELIEGGDAQALNAAIQEMMQLGIFEDEASAEMIARRKARGVFRESVANSRLTLETLDGIVRGFGSLPGRKVLFLLSDGFLTGISARSGAGFDLRRIADAGTRSGVVVYALDTRGMVAVPPGGSASSRRPVANNQIGLVESLRRRSEEAERDAMHALAADTGGFLVENSNDLGAGLRRMLKDTEAYYVLAYEPTNTQRDGSFRKVEVRLPGQRDIKVRTRSGYLAPDDRTARKAPEARPPVAQVQAGPPPDTVLRGALESSPSESAIPVRLSADFVKAENGVPQVVVSANIDTTTLLFDQARDDRQATVDLASGVYDASGTLKASLENEQRTIDLAPSGGHRALTEGLAYQKGMALEPGRYEVRLAAVQKGTGMLGSASQWVEIPDLAGGRLALSSLFLMQAVGAPDVGSAGADAAPVLRSAQALRRFRRDESLYLWLYAYNPKRDASGATSLVSQSEVLRSGVLLGSATPEVMAQGEAQSPLVSHTSRIKLQPLEPGDYELRVTVTDRNAQEKATRSVGFTVK